MRPRHANFRVYRVRVEDRVSSLHNVSVNPATQA